MTGPMTDGHRRNDLKQDDQRQGAARDAPPLAVRTCGLTRRFGELTAVDSLDLEVPEGSLFGLLGPNGAGKTTTLRMLLGLLAPTAGTVEILGGPVNPGRLARVGYVSEERGMYGYMTVEEMVGFTRRFYSTWDDRAVRDYLDLFRLPRRTRVADLSHGMRSLLALTLALGPRPDLLILDEPTEGLDPVMRREFLSMLVKEMAGTRRTLLFSSHVLNEVERIADTVAIINRGRLVMTRSVEEMRTNEKRVRFVPQRRMDPRELEGPGVRRVEREGSGFVLTVTDDLDAVLARLSTVPHFVLEVMDLDLEEVFFEYVKEGGGSREDRG
ncbi:MAG TPA: ABC transporter ATP-binding protein [Clostridiales bacterium]|nr:ABC transporter ATP-binding protein [Clostridiales bacterium]